MQDWKQTGPSVRNLKGRARKRLTTWQGVENARLGRERKIHICTSRNWSGSGTDDQGSVLLWNDVTYGTINSWTVRSWAITSWTKIYVPYDSNEPRCTNIWPIWPWRTDIRFKCAPGLTHTTLDWPIYGLWPAAVPYIWPVWDMWHVWPIECRPHMSCDPWLTRLLLTQLTLP